MSPSTLVSILTPSLSDTFSKHTASKTIDGPGYTSGRSRSSTSSPKSNAAGLRGTAAKVTVYVPPDPPEAIVFAGDGQGISKWGRLLEKADVPSTMIVGVHRLTDETLRLHEYSPGFEPERFAAHEKFFVEDVRRWTESRVWRGAAH